MNVKKTIREMPSVVVNKNSENICHVDELLSTESGLMGVILPIIQIK